MRKEFKYITISFIFGVVFILLIQKLGSISQQHNTGYDAGRQVITGAWVGGLWNNADKRLHPEQLTELENKLNHKFRIAHYFRGWAEITGQDFLTDLNTLDQNGWTPMISTNPYFFSNCIHKEYDLYKTLATGGCDDHMRAIARNLRAFGKPIYFRFAWEMNIVDMDWGVQRVGSSPSDFVYAWQRFHKIMDEEGAMNVLWVLAYNTHKPDSVRYHELYPGDQFVDWVAIDGYNWGNTQEWSTWLTFDQVFRASYQDAMNLSPTLPIMISEFNSASEGGDKARWFKDMLDTQIPKNYPRVQAIVFFNEDKTVEEQIDWRLENSANVVKSVEKSLKSKIYKTN